MRDHVQTSYLDSSEVIDIFDCVALCARGRYWFENIRAKENLKSLDDDLNEYLHSRRIHDLEHEAHKAAFNLRTISKDELAIVETLNAEEEFWNSARDYFLTKYNASHSVRDEDLWALVGKETVLEQFKLSKKVNKPQEIREFVRHTLHTLSWWRKQLKTQTFTNDVILIYRNGNANQPLCLKANDPSERDRLGDILTPLNMTRVIRVLKPETGYHKPDYPNITFQIDNEIGYKTSSFEALMQALNRGKQPPSFFSHLTDNLQF